MRTCIIILVALFSMLASAEENVRVQVVEGKKWVCFTEEAAQKLLQFRLTLPVLEKKVELLEERVLNKDKQIVTLEEGATLLTKSVGVLTKKNTYLEDQIESTKVWWRNQYLWLALGVSLGVVSTLTIAEAVN